MRTTSGLTLLETVVAIAVCAIVLGALATVTTSSLQESRQGSHKVQATQVLDTVGRRIAGGLDPEILLATGNSLTISGPEVDQLMSLSAFRDGAFTVTVENTGTFPVGTTRLDEYRIQVCYQAGQAERCVTGSTLGRQGSN